MVKDAPGQDDESALEWGVDMGLKEGEVLPKDVEELTEAQYTIFRMAQTLKGTFEETEAGTIKGDAPTGLVLPA